MRLRKSLGKLVKVSALMVGLLVFFYLALLLHILYPFEKNDISSDSVWVLAVDREVRQIPTPAGVELLSYAIKGDGVHLLGYDAARYKWTQNPTDFEVWVNYWKKLGYEQIDSNWSSCDGLHTYLQKNEMTFVDICHDAETKTTWIEKT